MGFSIEDIYNSYKGFKEEHERQFPVFFYVVRPLSFYATWLALKMRLSANQVTFISLIFALFGSAFLALGYEKGAYIGGIILNIFWILDSVDGNIARVKGTASSYGRFVDSMVGVIYTFISSFSIGVGLYYVPDYKLNSLISWISGNEIIFKQELFLHLGVASGLLLVLRFTYGAMYEKHVLNEDKADIFKESKTAGKIRYSASIPQRLLIPYLIYINVIEAQGIWPQLLLIAIYTKSLSIFIAFYAIAFLFDLLINTIWHAKRLKKIITERAKGINL